MRELLEIDKIQTWFCSHAIEKSQDEIYDYLYLWEQNKKDLFKLFGNRLIISRNISIEKDPEELHHDLFVNEEIQKLLNDLRGALLFSAKNNMSNEDYFELYCLFSDNAFYDNRMKGNFKYKHPNSSKYCSIHEGERFFKALTSTLKYFSSVNINDSYFTTEIQEKIKLLELLYSQAMNQKKIEGELCLSIHPLDYMTISDNGYDWNSCLNWDTGNYRAGTLELINSPCAIVAYLKGDKPWYFNWSNKKWREIFLYHPDGITSIKGYPYISKALEDEIFRIIAELAQMNTSTSFMEEDAEFCDYSDFDDHISILTNLLYNDAEYNVIRTRFKKGFELTNSIQYAMSGKGICPSCNGELDCAFSLLCGECAGFDKCSDCGEYISDDAPIYWIDSENKYVCENCYQSYVFCDGCKRDIHELNGSYLTILIKKESQFGPPFYSNNNEKRFVSCCNFICDDCFRKYRKYIVDVYYDNNFYRIIHPDTPKDIILALFDGIGELTKEDLYRDENIPNLDED